jgi:hypothetical protein
MTNLSELTSSRLKRIIAIMELIEKLQGRIVTIARDEEEVPTRPAVAPKKRRAAAKSKKPARARRAKAEVNA